jgi:hypothetical protein
MLDKPWPLGCCLNGRFGGCSAMAAAMAPNLIAKHRQSSKSITRFDIAPGEMSVQLALSPTLKEVMLHRVPNAVRGFVPCLRGQIRGAAALWLLAAAALLPGHSAMAADNNTPAPPANAQAAPAPDGTSPDEYADAQHQISGPAGNPECVWLGRKAVSRLWNDDIDTAFRDLDLYDRFGCPGAHVQAAVRCIVLHQPVSGDRKGADQKPSDTLDFRVRACWLNPTSPAIPAAAAAAPPAPAAAAPGAPAAPAPASNASH